jgi:hypothetical protein
MEQQQYNAAVRLAQERFAQAPSYWSSGLGDEGSRECMERLRPLVQKVSFLPDVAIPRSVESWHRLQEDWSEAVEDLHTHNDVFFRTLRECERRALSVLGAPAVEACQ